MMGAIEPNRARSTIHLLVYHIATYILRVNVSMKKMKTKVVVYLATFEREVPPIFMHAYPHVVIHMPAQIFRWGSARNIWCFFLERYIPSHFHVKSQYATQNSQFTCLLPCHRFVGWVKEFVMGRNKPAASVINAYTRLTFLRRMHPAIRAIYTRRKNTQTFKGALGQFLRPYDSYKDQGTDSRTIHPYHSILPNGARFIINGARFND
jgi:hypothetical protein